MERGRGLVDLCLKAATESSESVEKWRRQRRTLERLPSQLSNALFRRLFQRRLLFPSLLEVFQHSTDEVDLRGDSSVDAEWLAYVGAFRYLHSLNIADCKSINNFALWPLSGHSRLKELDMSRCFKITDAGIKHLLSIESLEKLSISEIRLSADGVCLLSSLVNLRVLDLGGIPVTDIALLSLQVHRSTEKELLQCHAHRVSCPLLKNTIIFIPLHYVVSFTLRIMSYVLTKLEYLDLWGSEISNIGATTLEKFPMLNYLNIAWTKVTRLPNLPITSLNMSKCSIHSVGDRDDKSAAPLSKLVVTGATFFDTDEVFSCLQPGCLKFLDISHSNVNSLNFTANLQGLKHLDLSYCQLINGSMEQVASIGENLSYLDLSNTKITSHSLSILIGCVPNLENVSLSHSLVDDASLAYISMLPSLRVVDLSYTLIRGFVYSNQENSEKRLSLTELQKLTHLRSLNLEDTKVIDEALHPLSFLTELECLYLKSDLLTDISLLALSSLQKLRFLGFRGCVITDYGLLSYRTPPLLSVFDLRGSWLLSANAISSFCRKYEEIEVRHEHVNRLFVDDNVPYSLPAPFTTTKATLSRLRMEKSSKRPSFTSSFSDERIKYSAEELLELKSSPGSRCTQENLDLVPGILRRNQ